MPAFEASVKEAHVGRHHGFLQPHERFAHVAEQVSADRCGEESDWGFDGLIMSDWSATYDGVEATNAGQDLEMPSGLYMNRQTLKAAIEQGKVSVDTINDKRATHHRHRREIRLARQEAD